MSDADILAAFGALVVPMSIDAEEVILAKAEQIKKVRNEVWLAKAREIQARAAQCDKFDDTELVYAAYGRCVCGAGFAYPKDCGPHHYWDCSDILTHRAEAGVMHSQPMAFTFYEVKSECQPSANGATTRPKQES